MELVEFVGQRWHEAVVVINHATEVLKAGLGGGNGEVITAWTVELRGVMTEG